MVTGSNRHFNRHGVRCVHVQYPRKFGEKFCGVFSSTDGRAQLLLLIGTDLLELALAHGLHRERTRAVFDEYDADKTGAISVGNLAEVLKKTGTDASRKQVGALLKEYDPDGSGHIEFGEFEEVYINRAGLTDFAVALHAI